MEYDQFIRVHDLQDYLQAIYVFYRIVLIRRGTSHFDYVVMYMYVYIFTLNHNQNGDVLSRIDSFVNNSKQASKQATMDY
jgi:hypothetical protein